MIRSTDRIRTTHVGSLARPKELLDLMKAARTRCSSGEAGCNLTARPGGNDGAT